MRQDPHSYADDTQPRTCAWDLQLTVDMAARRLTGQVTLTLDGAQGGPLDLDTRALAVERVEDAQGNAIPWVLDPADAILGARLRLTLPKGCDHVTLHYATSPDATALQWLEPQQTAGGQHPFLFSQCQAIHARSMVPCQDTPGIRVSYRAALTVPAGLTAVMAAASVGHGAGTPAGTTTFRFEMPQPIPSYLLALAVGDLASQDLGPRCRVWAEPKVLPAAAREFSDVERMVTAAEGLLGPYLWDRFDMLVMPPSFPYGGMENPRLTFLTPTLLAGDKSLVNVVVHELSHSWTGNLVTNASLEHFWLNEGFTVYAERRLQELLEGPQGAALHAAIGLAGLREDMERLGRDGPLTRLRTQLQGTDPDEVYSQVPYEKGFLFLTRLEAAVGRPAWDVFLRAYIETFRFQSITTDTFVAFLRKTLPQAAAAVDLDTWIHGTGLPKDAPLPHSARLDELVALCAAWRNGTRPPVDTLKAFSPTDWQVVLARLEHLPVAECAFLETTFDLGHSGNMEVRVGYLTLAVRAGHAAALPQVDHTLRTVGRMKYLRPLYTALKATPEGLTAARATFEKAKAGYHPVARAVMEGVLR
jgi:leukotriene-A4 hydrolase